MAKKITARMVEKTRLAMIRMRAQFSKEDAKAAKVANLAHSMVRWSDGSEGPVIGAMGLKLDRKTRLTIFVEKSERGVFRNITMLNDRKFVGKRLMDWRIK